MILRRLFLLIVQPPYVIAHSSDVHDLNVCVAIQSGLKFAVIQHRQCSYRLLQSGQ
jgi:hypothetical protein